MQTTIHEPDLWPADLSLQHEETPVSLLKAQAEALSDRTHNAVTGWVESKVSQGKLIHEFSVVAPLLGTRARVPLFELSHSVESYFPVTCHWIADGSWQILPVADLGLLRDWIRGHLASSRTRRIVSQMYAQGQQ